ncbi:restriction endonuclease subunit S [Ligilactobacillus salivarius]|uniref:Restriction endonuclease n=1 Tax=Ligilactobacillus salivarius TaxID=1624 RepID=A0A1V9R7S1_9LACO|nr:restriction endonuclease subunit S [Ligilactobacillus salivarius]OQQ89118.1 restriction endonuclease [Ligilactobacillus salivarius]
MRYRIKDVAKINERAINKKYSGTINYIDTSSVTDNVFNDPKVYSSIKEAPSRARRVANLGDTIISTVRPNMKHTGFVDKTKYKDCIYSTGFAVVTPLKDRVDPFYLYLVLTNNKNTELLQSIGETSTSTYPSVKPSDIENLEHDFPSINEQKEISTTIKMLESKIYLNNKINTNLVA